MKAPPAARDDPPLVDPLPLVSFSLAVEVSTVVGGCKSGTSASSLQCHKQSTPSGARAHMRVNACLRALRGTGCVYTSESPAADFWCWWLPSLCGASSEKLRTTPVHANESWVTPRVDESVILLPPTVHISPTPTLTQKTENHFF